MSTSGPTRAPAKTAADVCRNVPLGDEARKLLQDGLLPRPFLDLLIEKGHHADAARFMAHAMPRREAVWWACLCVRLGYGADLPPKAGVALQAAEKWVVNPSEDTRRATQVPAEAADLGQPAGMVGMAVFFSGGSLAPPGVTEVPPMEHLTATMVGNAVNLAALLGGPPKMAELYRQYFALGFAVASGQNRWKEPSPTSPSKSKGGPAGQAAARAPGKPS